MPGMAAVVTNRETARKKKAVDAGKPRTITVELDDGGEGGTVICSYRGDDKTPYGGETKKHSFESHESILGFVRAKLFGTDEPKADAPVEAETPAEDDAEGGDEEAPDAE